MTFATRADLLARSNARRLAQLAVPADVDMPPDDALRVAVAGGDLSGYTVAQQASLTLALDAIDKALGDAEELVISYGIPAGTQTPLLARLTSTIALYFLQGAERMTDDVSKAYDGAIATLKAHARGELNLVPVAPAVPPLPADQVLMESAPRRYGGQQPAGDW
ncbi:phage protein Gp36 family protein [Candidatus Ferrigenium straubiae]|jgi:phage gp36-like protein|uniref:phage protein Gp36 family protein n=1 Tax=Candidatus Ferrigenium straubiae TaxID=2919506 RepID=UPI003F4A8C1B